LWEGKIGKKVLDENFGQKPCPLYYLDRKEEETIRMPKVAR
jgi:hypothetical protein